MKTQNINTCDDKKSPTENLSQYNYPHLFKTAYGPKLKISSDFTAAGDRTKQSFKAECDINNIMARYQRTGVIDFAQKHEAQYADCTGLEFESGMQTIARARAMFEDLPSKLRQRFENEPAKFLEFVQNPKNREEAKELGLLKPEAAAAIPLPAPHPDDRPAAPLNRAAVRKQAREDADRAEARDDKDQSPT